MEKTVRTPLARPSLLAMGAFAALAVAAIPSAALFAQAPAAPYTITETGQGFNNLQEAVDAIGGGSGTIPIAPGSHRQCAVQKAGNISYLASQPGTAVFDGVACERKAALVLRGSSARVSGLVFANMSVPDGNGAGIRLETGDLVVSQSWFRDSQAGILTATDPNGSLVADKTTFTRLGACRADGGCSHSLYVGGHYGSLRVTRSRFEQGRGGHYLKSRSGRAEIAGNSFDDANGSETNYMIDLPEGAQGQITNNWFVQGQNKQNYSAFIAIGAEENGFSSQGLLIAGNDARFASGVRRNSTFVGNWSGYSLDIKDNNLAAGLQQQEAR